MNKVDVQLRRTILTYALVSSSVFNTNDILIGLMPLLVPLAKPGEIYEPADMVSLFEKNYNLAISRDVAEFLIPRLLKTKHIEETSSKFSGITYRWCNPQPNQSNEVDKTKEIEKKVDDLLEHFSVFVSNFKSLEVEGTNQDECVQALIDCILGRVRNLQSAESALLETQDIKVGRKEHLNYIAARYIETLETENNPRFELLSRLTGAAMFSEVIADLQSPPDLDRDLKHLTVIIDSPIVMAGLDVSGTANNENFEFVFQRLIKGGAKLVVLSHSIDEIQYNLKAVLTKLPSERVGPTATAIRSGQLEEEYALSIMRGPTESIGKLGLTINNSDVPVTPAQISRFDDERCNELFSKLNQTERWNSIQSIDHDVKSIAYVMRRLRGRSSVDPLNASILLLTNNTLLSRITRRYCTQNGLIREGEVGPVVSQRRMAALLWLNSGNQDRAEISKLQLLLNCHSIADASSGVLQAIQNKLGIINPEKAKQYKALLTQPRSVQVALDMTLNDPMILTNENVFDLLDAMIESTGEKARAHFKAKEVILKKQIKKLEFDKNLRATLDFQNAATTTSKAFRRVHYYDSILRIFLCLMVGLGLFLTTFNSNPVESMIGFIICVIFAVSPILPRSDWYASWLKKMRLRGVVNGLQDKGLIDHMESLDIDWSQAKFIAEEV